MIPFDRAAALFRRIFSLEPQSFAFAPGRVNLIGEHIDYAGGTVLPMAIEEGITVAALPQPERSIIYSERFADYGAVDIHARPAAHAPSFIRLAQGLCRELSCGGFHAVVLSDIPPGAAGLSSSAAYSVALSGALMAMDSSSLTDPLAVCRLCQQAELDGLGVECGLMDQYSAMFARKGSAMLLDIGSAGHTYVGADLQGARFYIVDSGQPRTLAASGYNQRRLELRRAMKLLGVASESELRALLSATGMQAGAALPDPLSRRIRHIDSEQRRVFSFAAALEKQDFESMGALLKDSHGSLSTDYEVSTPEINLLVQMLCELPGVHGARIVGGGFGGAVLLLAADGSESAIERTLRTYESRTTHKTACLPVSAGGPALLLNHRWDGGSVALADWLAGSAEH